MYARDRREYWIERKTTDWIKCKRKEIIKYNPEMIERELGIRETIRGMKKLTACKPNWEKKEEETRLEHHITLRLRRNCWKNNLIIDKLFPDFISQGLDKNTPH